jgi:hypothetical protein
MKICFNLIPPVNKLIALIVCMLLILSFTKLKADNNPTNFDTAKVSFRQMTNVDAKTSINRIFNNK